MTARMLTGSALMALAVLPVKRLILRSQRVHFECGNEREAGSWRG